METPDGFLWVDKPGGMSSHDVVHRVRKALKTKRVGHCGTLDPMATGLLVVAVGKATRLVQFLEGLDKAYAGTAVLGSSTTTEDAEGEVVETAEVHVAEEAVRKVLRGMVGELQQQPPRYSAVKVKGQRLYAVARRRDRRGQAEGKGGAVEAEPERPWRTVHVRRLELVAFDGRERIEFETRVSKGTYVRTLAVEMGRRLGVPAHLAALRRTEVGDVSVEDALALEDVEPGRVRPPLEALPGWPRRTLSEAEFERVSHGQPLPLAGEPGAGPILLVGPGDRLAAVAEPRHRNGGWELRYRCVLIDSSHPAP